MTGRANIPRKADILALLLESDGLTSEQVGRALGIASSRACNLLGSYRASGEIVLSRGRRWKLARRTDLELPRNAQAAFSGIGSIASGFPRPLGASCAVW